MPIPDKELRAEIESKQRLPIGRCTDCAMPTGRIANYYARLEIPEAGMVMRLPICDRCVAKYVAMWEAERPRPAKTGGEPTVKKMRKTA